MENQEIGDSHSVIGRGSMNATIPIGDASAPEVVTQSKEQPRPVPHGAVQHIPWRMRVRTFFEGRSAAFVATLGLACVLFVGVSDYISGSEISFSIFYMVPVFPAAWLAGAAIGDVLAVVAAGAWLTADLARGFHYTNAAAPYWNAALRLIIFVFGVHLVTALRRFHRNLQSLVEEKVAALTAEITERERAEKEVLEISNREQRKVAYDLHDGICSILAGITLQVKHLENSLDAQPAKEDAAEIGRLLNDAIRQTRTLARSLDPIEVEAGDLPVALQRLAQHTAVLFRIPCQCTCHPSVCNLTPSVATQVYGIAREAIHNAIRHGEPTSVKVELGSDSAGICLRVRDDGIGFTPGAEATAGMGLRIMRYRAMSVGGTFAATSSPGQGTTVICSIPAAVAAGSAAN